MIPEAHKAIMAEMIRKYSKDHNLIPRGETLDVQFNLRSEVLYLYDDPYESFREFCERTGESKWIITRALNTFYSLGFEKIKDVASYGTKDNENWYRVYGINHLCKTFKIIRKWLSSIGLGTGMDFNTLEPICGPYNPPEDEIALEAGARDSCLCGAENRR
jgi:hypothetical protein